MGRLLRQQKHSGLVGALLAEFSRGPPEVFEDYFS